MKIRFEAQITTIRINKDEFSKLLKGETITEKTEFPGGERLSFHLNLGFQQNFIFTKQKMEFTLPNQSIHNYTPRKVGLSFVFPLMNNSSHQLIFEVDIKKSPLGKNLK